LFSVHFRLICIGSLIGVVAFVVAERPIFAAAPALIGGLAILMRQWILRSMDAELCARDAGDGQAVRRLHALHWRAMAYNATQFVAIVAITPFVFAPSG